MQKSISRVFLFILFVSFTGFGPGQGSALAAAVQRECPVCSMRFKEAAKTSFSTLKDGKPLHLCSFACAAKLSSHHSEASFEVVDFISGKPIGAEKSFFLIRSKNLLKELDFDMPPSVVAFADETQARAKQKNLGDGEVLHGWKDLKKNLAP